jgi:anti-sigma B factor antagonist
MDITAEKLGDVTLLGIKGRLDASTANKLEEKLLASIDEGERRLALDCSQLDYISSAGLRVLLLAVKRVKGVNGKIVLCALKDQIKEVFDIAGFSSLFPSFATQEEALRSCGQ